MSKKVSKILSVLLAVLMLVSVVPMTASAAVFEGTCGADGDNLTWKIDESTATLYINGTGDMKDYSLYFGTRAPWYQYYNSFIYVSIGDDVTSIGDNAFAYSSLYVEDIEIGKGIKKIGYNSFNLDEQTVTVNTDNPYLYIDENGYVLSKDNTIFHSVLRKKSSISIPDGVLEIRAFAFYGQPGNTEYQLNISASVQKIDLHKGFIENQPAFYVDENNQYFSSDEYGALFNKDKTIIYRGVAAARNAYPCYKIPETVTEVADYAFYNYLYIDGEATFSGNIEITENVKQIGKESFCNAGGGGKLFIPLSVEYLDPYFAYIGDEGWTDVYYEGTQEQWRQIYSRPYSAEYEEEYIHINYEHSNHIFKDKDLGNCTTASSCITCGFIAEANVEHVWEKYNWPAAPCLDGYIEYRCDNCGEYKTEKSPATEEHDWRFYSSKAASCVDGYIEYRCDNCGNYKTETIPATGEHDWYTEWETYDCGYSADFYCYYCDAQKTEMFEHNWELEWTESPSCGYDGVEEYYCDYCGQYKTETISATGEHDWEVYSQQAASCVDGYIKYQCNNCGSYKTETIPATGEHIGPIFDDRSASCVDDGYVKYECHWCKEIITDIIPATGEHAWYYDEDNFLPCEGGTRYYYCENGCGTTKTEEIEGIGEHIWYITDESDFLSCIGGTKYYRCYACGTTKSEYVEGTGHDWQVGGFNGEEHFYDCKGGTIDYFCDVCDAFKLEFIEGTGEHDWGRVEDDDFAPCEGGYRYYFCVNECGATKTEYAEPTEHDWRFDYGDYRPCSGGTKYYSCSYACGASKSEYIEGTGEHEWKYYSNHDATCTQDGTKYLRCEICFSYGDDVVDEGSALGHDYTERTVLTQQTCTQDGVSIQRCKRCDDMVVFNEKAYAHYDENEDGKCDECSVSIEVNLPDEPETPDEPGTSQEKCTCNCHKSGFFEFIWKILCFFYRLFGINPVCDCNVNHY